MANGDIHLGVMKGYIAVTDDDKALVEPKYLLMKRGFYYAPDRKGYTGLKRKAGRYLLSDAHDGVIAVHEDEAGDFAPNCCSDIRADEQSTRIAELSTTVERLSIAVERAAQIIERNLGRQDEKVPDATAILRAALNEVK